MVRSRPSRRSVRPVSQSELLGSTFRRWILGGFIAFCTALSVAGCAGIAEYPLGIPTSSAPKFYAAMTAVASAHGMQISNHPDSLNIETADGDWLQYMQRPNGSISLVVIANTKGLDDDEIETRKTKLKALSDSLVNEARKTASDAKVFE
jgi:hypothetical protein